MPQAFPGQRLSRIALITGSLKLGGATTFLCTFGSELLKRGIETRIYSFEAENPLNDDFKRAGLAVFSQDERGVLYEDRLRNVLRHLATFKPQVVLANLSPSSYEVLRYLPLGVFRVMIAHADDPNVYAAISPYSKSTDLIGTVSQTILERFGQLLRVQAPAIKYLPLGVPMPERAVSRYFDGPLRILYLGRLDKAQKRVHLFPEIYAELALSGVRFHWTIAGDGHDRVWLETAMRDAVADRNVTFLGKLSYTEVPPVLAQNDVFLLASDAEGLPLGVLEAMGSGMVPVVSDLESGIRELVDHSTGVRVPVSDTAGYARAIIALDGDREGMKKLSVAARERVLRQFSPQAMVDRWLHAFPNAFEEANWPFRWTIHPPLTASTNWRFTWWGTIARRMGRRFRRQKE